MGRGQNQQGKARVPKANPLTPRQRRQAQDGSGVVRGMRKVVKGGVVRWLPIKKK